MQKLITPFLLSSLLLTTPYAAALELGDAKKGKTLHASQCMSCHGAEAYTRKDRKIKSREGLLKQVNLCNSNLDKNFSDDQINDIVKFLNDTYYQFK